MKRNYSLVWCVLFFLATSSFAQELIHPKSGDSDMFRGKIIVAADSIFPKNGEGSTIRLKDNRLLHMVSRHMNGGSGSSDFWPSIIAKMYSSDNGLTWTKPEKVFDHPIGTRTCMQPSLVYLVNGELGVAYSKYDSSEKAVKVFRHSKDGGNTWSGEVLISPNDGYYSAAHNRMIVLSNGQVIIPLHRKFVENGATKIYTQIAYSKDNGRSWKMGTQTLGFNENIKKSVFAEATLAELSPGKLVMLGRTEKGFLYACYSEDFGLTWTQPEKTMLESPPASLNLIKLANSNDLLLIWQGCCSSNKRLTLSSAISTDSGKTWKWQREMVTVAAEYGDAQYPTALMDGNQIIVTYRAVKRLYKPRYIMEEHFLTLPLNWFYVGRDYSAPFKTKD